MSPHLVIVLGPLGRAEICGSCGTPALGASLDFDAYGCPSCDIWLDPACAPEAGCPSCRGRPARPSEAADFIAFSNTPSLASQGLSKVFHQMCASTGQRLEIAALLHGLPKEHGLAEFEAAARRFAGDLPQEVLTRLWEIWEGSGLGFTRPG